MGAEPLRPTRIARVRRARPRSDRLIGDAGLALLPTAAKGQPERVEARTGWRGRGMEYRLTGRVLVVLVVAAAAVRTDSLKLPSSRAESRQVHDKGSRKCSRVRDGDRDEEGRGEVGQGTEKGI